MARLKKEIEVLAEDGVVLKEIITIPTQIAKLSVDLGREDLNNISKTVNELNDRLQEVMDRLSK